MPLVFVHGVANRRDLGGAYDRWVAARTEYFRSIALVDLVDPKTVTVENPYWGDLGASLRWKNASLPEGDYETFGGSDQPLEEIAAEAIPAGTPPKNQVLLTAARASLVAVADGLWAAGVQADSALVDAGFVVNGVKAVRYAEANPKPAWLGVVKNDDQFVDRLLGEVDTWNASGATSAAAGVEHYGINAVWNRIKTGATMLANAALRVVANPIAKALRPSIHGGASIFLGDVMAYLSTRGERGAEGPIVRLVADAIGKADAARKTGDERLIVVAHSMGGNICYDVLSHYRPNIIVDLFLTVGSQVGLFEELKLFKASDPNLPSPGKLHVARPAKVTRWINVFDRADLLAYGTNRIFEGAEDFAFDGGTHALAAHGSYFVRPKFYERMRVRLAEPPK